MTGPKARVFVSSVMEGFESYREAARNGIEAAGAEPVMAEDWPSQGRSSRTSCLDLVASSDALILVIGDRGGWTAPSGRLVVEEEFQEARKRKLPVRVFVQDDVTRDAAAERLATEVSDYVEGLFRRTFTDLDSLSSEVRRALAGITSLSKDSMSSPDRIDLRSLAETVDQSHPNQAMGMGRKTMRFVLAPERSGEVIDPRRMDDDDFQHAIMTLAQEPKHRLIEYGQTVAPIVRKSALVLERTGSEPSWRERRPARIEIHENGLILIDVPLDNPQDLSGTASIPWHVLDARLVRKGIVSSILFSGAVYDLVDRFHRFDRFHMDVAFSGVQGSVLEEEPQPRSSYTIPNFDMSAGPLVLLERPRLLSRWDLKNPEDEVDRFLTYLRRAL